MLPSSFKNQIPIYFLYLYFIFFFCYSSVYCSKAILTSPPPRSSNYSNSLPCGNQVPQNPNISFVSGSNIFVSWNQYISPNSSILFISISLIPDGVTETEGNFLMNRLLNLTTFTAVQELNGTQHIYVNLPNIVCSHCVLQWTFFATDESSPSVSCSDISIYTLISSLTSTTNDVQDNTTRNYGMTVGIPVAIFFVVVIILIVIGILTSSPKNPPTISLEEIDSLEKKLDQFEKKLNNIN